jgi:hypothetical protein
LRKPDKHAQAEPADLAILDLRYPSLRDAEVFSRFDLRQLGFLQPLANAAQQLGTHSSSAASSAGYRSWNTDLAIVIA